MWVNSHKRRETFCGNKDYALWDKKVKQESPLCFKKMLKL